MSTKEYKYLYGLSSIPCIVQFFMEQGVSIIKHELIFIVFLFFISLKRVGEEKDQRLTVLEECKSSLQQEALKLRTNMRELEKSRLQARRELQELRRQVRAQEKS